MPDETITLETGSFDGGVHSYRKIWPDGPPPVHLTTGDPMTQHPTPEAIRAALVTTKELAEIFGINDPKTAANRMFRLGYRPVIDTGRYLWWHVDHAEAAAERIPAHQLTSPPAGEE
jgi:hypothetical protein